VEARRIVRRPLRGNAGAARNPFPLGPLANATRLASPGAPLRQSFAEEP
jgi:hypothetical protein